MNAQGSWVLVVESDSTVGATGAVTSWSLSFQKPVPTSGLGEPGADNITASFRLFTLNPSNGISGEAWTPVGRGIEQRHRRAEQRILGSD